jgi:hypothetical protein
MTDNDQLAARHLWQRLNSSLANEAEKLVFRSYTKRYGTYGLDSPALVPQVYLHYDPYARASGNASPGSVIRQRMDFLLLLPHRTRIVIEVDGKQHYSTDDGRADPVEYSRMMSEDRRLRLLGYEVYRFGGYELLSPGLGEAEVDGFFDALLARHAP